MPSAHELFSEQFYRWEKRGRGWQVFEEPVRPEPPFAPFFYSLPEVSIDDGRRPTLISSFVQSVSRRFSGVPEIPSSEEEPDPEPDLFERPDVVEFRISLPRDFDPRAHTFGQFLSSIFPCQGPLAFEIIGMREETILQMSLSPADSTRVKKQIGAFFPGLSILETQNVLASVWAQNEEFEAGIFELGLAREFMLPLATPKLDLYIGLAAALSELRPHELGVFQVIFQPLDLSWNDSITRALTHGDGKPLFVNQSEITKAGNHKASQPLFAAVVRIATKAGDFDRAWDIARDLACACSVLSNPVGNELVPLENREYPPDAHEEDLLLRQTRRSGMILTLEELLGFVHLPSLDVPKLAREITKTKAPPSELTTGILLGHNTHAGKTAEVRLPVEHRVRHTHIIGASGTGKTTLLYNLIRQDIENGEGVAVLDPHGDLVDRILSSIPENRLQDVVLIDPSDEEYSVGFNILSAHSDLEKHLLASDLTSIFQRLSTSWGDQMASVLQNAVLAFLESKTGGTLADLRRFLIEPAFRNEFLKTVEDAEVHYYWNKAFPQLTGNKSIGPVLTRLETFLAPKPIRYMVSQKGNRLDFAKIMDTGKIFLAKLSEGLLGKENSYLLGALLLAKFQQTAMSRQRQQAGSRKDFWLYMDEFQNFISPSLAEILTGARKYRMGLVLAHHELRQLERDKEVASAVLSNCDTRIVFRVGDDDARKLADGFASFDARDLQNLSIGKAICRVERSDFDFNLTISEPQELDEATADELRREAIAVSRKMYATPVADIRKILDESWKKVEPDRVAPATTTIPEQKIHAKHAEPAETKIEVKPPIAPEPASEVLPSAPAPAALKVAKPVAVAVPGLGKGGAQHKTIQQRLKKAGEKYGFRSHIEKPILDGQGSIDILFESETHSIPCEISVTNTIDYEVGNVVKCLKAGFQTVAVICLEETRLSKLRAAIAGSLGAESAGCVQYFLPDEFIAHLEGLASSIAKPKDTVKQRLGYAIKHSKSKLSVEQLHDREAAKLRTIAEVLKKQTKGPV